MKQKVFSLIEFQNAPSKTVIASTIKKKLHSTNYISAYLQRIAKNSHPHRTFGSTERRRSPVSETTNKKVIKKKKNQQ